MAAFEKELRRQHQEANPGMDDDRLRAAFFQPRSAGGILTELVPVRE